MHAFKTALLFTVAATSVVADYASVLAKLQNPVDSTDLPNLKTAINNYPSSGSTNAGVLLLKIQQANKQVQTDVNNVTSDASGSAVPSSTQAQTVLNYVGGTLFNDTKAVLVALDAKQANLIANGVKSTVKTELNNTKTAVDNLANALIAKAPTASQASSGQTIKNNYDAEFTKRINAYS